MWYELTLSPDDNGTWLVTAPEFAELVTFGDTTELACRNGLNAIEEAIAARIATNEPVPFPLRETKGRGWFVEVPAIVFLKSALYMTMKSEGKSRADLVRLLNCKREHVERLLRLDHNSRITSLEDAFRVLGHPLRFDMDFPAAA